MENSKAVQCPQCESGNLIFIQPVELIGEVTSLNPFSAVEDNAVEVIPIEDAYIGCNQCDLMGSIEDVLEMRRKSEEPEEPRYIAYEVAQKGDVAFNAQNWVLTGVFEASPYYDKIAVFHEQKLAFAMLYRISGITGVPDQTYYPLKEE